jgi:isoamylase
MPETNQKEKEDSKKEILELTLSTGSPLPFGISFQPNGVNFSLFSKNATAVTLNLFLPKDSEPIYEIPLDPEINKTGDVWHIFVENISDGLHYAYNVDGPFDQEKGHHFDSKKLVIDPYARALSSNSEWGTDEKMPLRGILLKPASLDWEKDKPPNIPMEEMIIYEMHVRGFTRDPSSRISHPGTFLGVIEKIPHLKALGINVVELLPIHAFNECENILINPKTKERLFNYWGYSTINFFAPMNKYATDKHQAIREFRAMVSALHKAGIEIILDVVFNHTAEGGENGPTISFKGIEHSIYYMLGAKGELLNFSGCGNTFNCNHPVARELIRTSLRYWVSEMHVDGFRFDLASILGRATDGTPLSSPPLLELIALDPVLANTKLIAEAWDAGGLYQVGSFPSWGVWAEWNGKYRDVVRRFIKGTPNMTGAFVTAICGSSDLYSKGRTPAHSINFITAHDGFSLADLVAYNEKHNLENGENNRDGNNQNDSWNCGTEGPTDNKKILELRERQMRNFHVALMVSLGVQMILMGDEY